MTPVKVVKRENSDGTPALSTPKPVAFAPPPPPKTALQVAEEAVAKARAELVAKESELTKLQKLRELFPDLQIAHGRWNRVVYSSALVNAQATDVFFRFNCGCCGDSPLEAWPFLTTEYGPVYSQPAHFQIGEKHWIAGARPYEKWKENLEKAGISVAAIDKVKARFAADRKERQELAESDDTVHEDPDPFD